MTKESAYRYWLASAGISYKKSEKLIERFGSIEALFEDPSLIRSAKGIISEKAMDSLKRRADKQIINSELKSIFNKNISVIAYEDERYPDLLKNISNPPMVLYSKGNAIRLTDKLITVVGTRGCTRAGYENTRKICRKLSENGVSIVSGMARGIDTAALIGAIEGGTPCAAVLGCGADVVYPRENADIYDKIVKNGVILSEYPCGTPPIAGNFPRRNRIMSGMSAGILIAQAPEKSGAAITLRYATEENRDIFAIPGNINEETSSLPNLLITEGAIPVTGAEDILNYYGWECSKKEKFVKKQGVALDFYEQRLYTLLKQGEMNIDDLAREADMDAPLTALTITSLEIKGIIERLPGNSFGVKL